MDHYKVLGLNRSATKEEIKEAFRKLALKFHPDKHSQSSKLDKDGATLRFKQISEAYGVLSDDQKRADYNLRSSASASAAAGSSGGSGGYYYGYSNQSSYYKPNYRTTTASSSSTIKGKKWVFEFDVPLHFFTTKGFLLNVAFASILLGGAVIIERSGQALWKMHNSGKSFEEAIESIEKIKTQNEKN